MTEGEIRERARSIEETFRTEAKRVATVDRMGDVLDEYGCIAGLVASGEYCRGGVFQSIVLRLRELGNPMRGADESVQQLPSGIREAARNAADDATDLWRASDGGHPTHAVVSAADDLMRTLVDDSLRWYERHLRDTVTEYVGSRDCKARSTASSALDFDVPGPATLGTVSGIAIQTAASRENPERVIFSPPATIAFWPDGTKTVARCAEGEEFSEYVGLLVCIAKRHVSVPRHAMFEDVMAKLLKRAERQTPKAKGRGDAA